LYGPVRCFRESCMGRACLVPVLVHFASAGGLPERFCSGPGPSSAREFCTRPRLSCFRMAGTGGSSSVAGRASLVTGRCSRWPVPVHYSRPPHTGMINRTGLPAERISGHGFWWRLECGSSFVAPSAPRLPSAGKSLAWPAVVIECRRSTDRWPALGPTRSARKGRGVANRHEVDFPTNKKRAKTIRADATPKCSS